MINVGIAGGTGFTAGELVRILLDHPKVNISWVYSQSNAGKHLSSAHPDLEDETTLSFTSDLEWDIEVLFLCLPHGVAATFIQENPVPEKVKIIDLSNDFRIGRREGFVYGLPELNRHEIIQAHKIANPGCFATAIQLALLPLADVKALSDDIHITAITGSTGAGKGLSDTTHFTWRTGNLSVYKAFKHQHLSEINQSINQLQVDFNHKIHFVPMRGNFTRGILASVYTNTTLSQEEALGVYNKYYKKHPFVRVTADPIDMKQIVNTNKALMSVNVIDGVIHVVSAIDNLLKGASGQAVQNLNLINGYDEDLGLRLKSIAY